MVFDQFNPECSCCVEWRKILQEKKFRARLSAKKYYTKNKEKVILSTLKRYYLKKKTKDGDEDR